MSLQVLDVLKSGLKNTFSTTGLELIGAFYILNILGQMVNDSLVAQSVLPMPSTGVSTPLAVTSVPAAVWGVLLLVALVANIWFAIGTLRNLVNRNFDSLDQEMFTQDLGMTALNMIAGSIVFSVAVVLGLLALIVPGLFLMVSLLFWSIFVAVEGDSFIDALKNSWELATGNRIDLFLIGLGVVGIGLLASLVMAVPNVLLSTVNPAASALLSLLMSAFGTVLGLVTLAEAYNELQ